MDSRIETRISTLHPQAASVARDYLNEVASALSHEPDDVRTEVVETFAVDLLDGLPTDADADSVANRARSLGLPDVSPAKHSNGLSGRVMGVPYDVRVPDGERIAHRWWNPADQRWLVPRVWGVGWALNMGAVAVRLGLIEPDAEDLPFESTPRTVLMGGLSVAVSIVAGMLATVLVLADQLPARIPAHWNMAGVPDAFWPRTGAFGFLLVMAVVPTLVAAVTLVRGRPGPVIGAWVSAAVFFSALSGSIWVLTLISVFTPFTAWWLPPALIVGALALTFAVVLWLARAGRAGEIARDLGRSVGL